MQSLHNIIKIYCLIYIISINVANAYQLVPKSIIKSYQYDALSRISYIRNNQVIVPSSIRTYNTGIFLFKKKDKELIDSKSESIIDSKVEVEGKEPSAFEQVASKGLAGVLAIACAESIFWALGIVDR